HNAAAAAKAILTGAHVVQLVSVVLKHGPEAIRTLRHGLQSWMSKHGFHDLQQFRGRLGLRSSSAAAFERANHIRVLQSWTL
ncbi:MAG TPA: dihydroorotate dehydrogenase-like protein, partial [Dehalococcoidia bacterium]